MMNDRPTIIAIMGPSASGKDTLARSLTAFLQKQRNLKLISNTSHMIVSDTTRPIRKGEYNGLDYNFIDWAEFAKREMAKEYIETYSYGPQNWMYGTPKDQLIADINIGVFSPSGLDGISKYYSHNYDIIPILLDCPKVRRLWRSIKRDGKPRYEHIRRMRQDNRDFSRTDYILRYDMAIDLRRQKLPLDKLTEKVYNILCDNKIIRTI